MIAPVLDVQVYFHQEESERYFHRAFKHVNHCLNYIQVVHKNRNKEEYLEATQSIYQKMLVGMETLRDLSNELASKYSVFCTAEEPALLVNTEVSSRLSSLYLVMLLNRDKIDLMIEQLSLSQVISNEEAVMYYKRSSKAVGKVSKRIIRSKSVLMNRFKNSKPA